MVPLGSGADPCCSETVDQGGPGEEIWVELKTAQKKFTNAAEFTPASCWQ